MRRRTAKLAKCVSKLAARGSLTLGALGLALAVKSFLPQPLAPESSIRLGAQSIPTIVNVSAQPIGGVGMDPAIEALSLEERQQAPILPEIDVSFLRCGSVTIPKCIDVRGASPFAFRVNAYSAVLVHHPKATFLYDTGLCSDIYTYLANQPLIFRKTLARFRFQQSLAGHL